MGVDDPCLWYGINKTLADYKINLQNRMLLISTRGPGAGRLRWLKRGSGEPRGAVIRLNYAFWICSPFVPYSLLSGGVLFGYSAFWTSFHIHNAVIKQNYVITFWIFSHFINFSLHHHHRFVFPVALQIYQAAQTMIVIDDLWQIHNDPERTKVVMFAMLYMSNLHVLSSKMKWVF